jgi:hypothetical protein
MISADHIGRPDVVYPGVAWPAGGRRVILIETPGGQLLGAVRHIIRHSPAGLNWGYGGSGPADTARSLLIDALGDAARCPQCDGTRRLVLAEGSMGPERPYDPGTDTGIDPERLFECYACDDGGWRRLPYQDFKSEYVAGWKDDWVISRAAILAWLERKQTEDDTCQKTSS